MGKYLLETPLNPASHLLKRLTGVLEFRESSTFSNTCSPLLAMMVSAFAAEATSAE